MSPTGSPLSASLGRAWLRSWIAASLVVVGNPVHAQGAPSVCGNDFSAQVSRVLALRDGIDPEPISEDDLPFGVAVLVHDFLRILPEATRSGRLPASLRDVTPAQVRALRDRPDRVPAVCEIVAYMDGYYLSQQAGRAPRRPAPPTSTPRTVAANEAADGRRELAQAGAPTRTTVASEAANPTRTAPRAQSASGDDAASRTEPRSRTETASRAAEAESAPRGTGAAVEAASPAGSAGSRQLASRSAPAPTPPAPRPSARPVPPLVPAPSSGGSGGAARAPDAAEPRSGGEVALTPPTGTPAPSPPAGRRVGRQDVAATPTEAREARASAGANEVPSTDSVGEASVAARETGADAAPDRATPTSTSRSPSTAAAPSAADAPRAADASPAADTQSVADTPTADTPTTADALAKADASSAVDVAEVSSGADATVLGAGGSRAPSAALVSGASAGPEVAAYVDRIDRLLAVPSYPTRRDVTSQQLKLTRRELQDIRRQALRAREELLAVLREIASDPNARASVRQALGADGVQRVEQGILRTFGDSRASDEQVRALALWRSGTEPSDD